ncbi:MAG: carbon monoxide dehydrogenase [Dehalococcoidia bacterium]|nr:MAG: carbon monoxide dehydrogenase [Dehalococcoidia bacterium]
MTFSIAIAGKGGSGKTTTCSLMIRELKNRGLTPILAVDADGNANLHESLGLKLGTTIGSILAEFNSDKVSIPSGMNKGAFLQVRLNQAIVESRGIDLIPMGRGEGTGCYCYPNSVLKEFIDRLKGNYKYMVMDNEAGMEHLSRRTTENIDELLIASDYSVKGIRTADRIRELVNELKLDVKRVSFILTRVPGKLDERITGELAELHIEPIALIPLDAEIQRFDLEQRSLLDLPDTSPAVHAVKKLMDEVLKPNPVGGAR